MAIGGIPSRTAGDVDANRFMKSGILVIIVVVLAGSAAQLIDYGFFGLRIGPLNSATNGGIFGAVGDIALAAAACSAWVLTARVRSARSVAAALAVLLTFLAVDEATRLHYHVPYWLAFYLPVLAATFICLVAAARGHAGYPRSRVDPGNGRAVTDRLIGIGLLLLTLSFLMHLSGDRLLLEFGAADYAGWAYQIKAVVKHGAEVAGSLLIVLGLLRLARKWHLDRVQEQSRLT
jgi:hypothetical protein